MAQFVESFEGLTPSGNVGFNPPYYRPGLLSPYTFPGGVVQLTEPLGGDAVVGDFSQGTADFGTSLTAVDVPTGTAYLALDTATGYLHLRFDNKKVYSVGAYVTTKSGDDPGMAAYDKNGKLIAGSQISDVAFSDWDSNYILLVSKKPIASIVFTGGYVAVDDVTYNTTKAKLVKGTKGNDNLSSQCTNGSEYVDGKGGNDKVNAKGGDDTVNLGPGKNKANGGDGDDKLICTGGTEKLIGGEGRDSAVVLDFAGLIKWKTFDPTEDTFILDASITGLVLGALNPNHFVSGSGPTDADDRIIYNPGTGSIVFDVDGSGLTVGEEIARVAPGAALTAADFLIQ